MFIVSKKHLQGVSLRRKMDKNKIFRCKKRVQERELYSCSLLYSNEKLKISENRSLHRANVKKKNNDTWSAKKREFQFKQTKTKKS